MDNLNLKKHSVILKPLLAVLLICFSLCSRAQLNPLQSIYFHNRYLSNPAMAGFEKGLHLSLGYRQQRGDLPGAPKTQVFTTGYQATPKVGLGLNITDEQSGLIRQTRAMGTYAYHLPLTDDSEKLNFGLSFGINDSGLDQNRVIGDDTDEQIDRYNQARPYVDGDLGVAYTSDSFFAEVVVPNLKSTFFKTSLERLDVDRLTFLTAISYTVHHDVNHLIFEPLAAYRRVKGTGDIFDAGANLTMSDYDLSLQVIYHSTKTTGIGVVFDQNAFALDFTYNTQRGIGNYSTSGALELGLRLKLFH
jgi:type IX secretion system PorP/SprF family membrane protein